jgi:hypothetical protein
MDLNYKVKLMEGYRVWASVDMTNASESEVRQIQKLRKHIKTLDLSKNLRRNWSYLDMLSSPDTSEEWDFDGKYKMSSVPCVCAWNEVYEAEFYPGEYITKWYITPADIIKLFQWRIYSEISKEWNTKFLQENEFVVQD